MYETKVEAVELLIGHCLDYSETVRLSAKFSDNLFEGGEFDGLLGILSVAAEMKRALPSKDELI